MPSHSGSPILFGSRFTVGAAGFLLLIRCREDSSAGNPRHCCPTVCAGVRCHGFLSERKFSIHKVPLKTYMSKLWVFVARRCCGCLPVHETLLVGRSGDGRSPMHRNSSAVIIGRIEDRRKSETGFAQSADSTTRNGGFHQSRNGCGKRHTVAPRPSTAVTTPCWIPA